MIMACTGGGILVPIFINSVPVPLAQDAYPIAIMTSFSIHSYFPILREVVALSPVFRVRLVCSVIFLPHSRRQVAMYSCSQQTCFTLLRFFSQRSPCDSVSDGYGRYVRFVTRYFVVKNRLPVSSSTKPCEPSSSPS